MSEKAVAVLYDHPGPKARRVNLVLTVVGRKSGIPRSTPLLCVPRGDTVPSRPMPATRCT